MKKVFLAAAVMAALSSTGVMAEDLTITGGMLEKGCIIGESGNADIYLDKITVAQVTNATVGTKFAEKAASFNIHNCPNYGIAITFRGDIHPTDPEAIVNDIKPSGDVVAHYMVDNSDKMSLLNLNGGMNLSAEYTPEEHKKALSDEGYDYPVIVGYKKVADVQSGVSPAGLTRSVVTLDITYYQ